jgi:HK97 family phage portal protein
VLVHAIWWGRGVFVFQESASGEPLPGSLFQLNPFMVGVDGGRWVIDPHGDTPVDTDFDGRFEVRGRVFRVGVVRGLPPHDQHTPEGVLQRHWSTFRLGAAVSDYVAGTFTSGVPAGFLKVSTPQTTSADLGKLKKTWMDAHGKGRRSIAVMNANVDFQPVSITPVDADAAEVARLSRIDVAHAFGLSAAWLDTGDGSLTYANLSDRRRDLVDITLSGWGASMMSALSQFLPYGTALRVNWATFTAPDLVEQIPALSQAVSAGWMTAAEARALTGLDAPGAASETVLDESMAQGD